MSENASIIGKTLRQHYKIIKQLGKTSGGFGETYLAEDLDRPADPKPRCVVKRLKPAMNYPKIVELFHREGKMLETLGSHDQIPTLYAYFEHEQKFYLVQELIEGDDLSKEITPGQRWSEAKVIKFLQEILEVLAFVHQNGVIHRDIKPANIMRRQRDGKLVLIDFGAVKKVSTKEIDEQGEVTSGTVIGTFYYMPNEQMHGQPCLASDIYAVGMTAIQALTGVEPKNLGDGNGNVNWPPRAQVSAHLANILTKMVQVNADDRYANATEVLQALRNIEPISGFLGWVLFKGILGFIAHPTNASLSKCQTGVQELIDFLEEANPSVNGELQKALRGSLLKAQRHIARAYQKRRGAEIPNFIQYLPFFSRQRRKDLRWVKQRLAQLDREIKAVNLASPVELTAELLTKLPSPDEIPQRKGQLLAALLKGDEPDNYVEMLQQDSDGLFYQVCAYFAREIKLYQQLGEILSERLLAPMGAELKMQDLETSLLRVTPDVEEYKRQYSASSTTVTFSIPDDNKIVKNLRLEPSEDPMADDNKIVKNLRLEPPEDSMAANSPWYVERPPIEVECYETIANPGALIRVKAPQKMGKSSLMLRILDRGEQLGYKQADLSFDDADGEQLKSLDRLLQWFCSRVSDRLKRNGLNQDRVADYWQDDLLGSKSKCTNYFQRYLLSDIPTPLVLGLDKVDKIFQHQEVAIEFFGLLRSWHERGKNDEDWEKLRLVIVHSQEVYIPLNTNQSPFNVGLPIELREFNTAEVADLVRRHDLDWSDEQVEKLMAMVGGHPYLVRKALYEIYWKKMTLESLLKVAPTEEGPYANHLGSHLDILKNNADLAAAIKQVLAVNVPVPIGTQEAFKLRSMGLVKFRGNAVIPLCNLYREYLDSHL